MEREDEHSPNGMPLCRFPEPVYATPSVSYNRFGGVRHGFNTGSNRTQPYPPVPSLVPCFRCLPPLRLISNDPDPDDRSWVPLTRAEVETPAPSPSSSQGLSFTEGDDVCINCHRDARYTLPSQSPVPDIELAQEAYDAASQYARVVVDDLLNSAQLSENRWLNGDRIPGFNNSSTDVNKPGRARTSSSTSSMSICSSTTLQPRFAITDDRVSLVSQLYYTCKIATDSYISTLRPIRHHASRSSRSRHHPYSMDSRPACHGRPPSLMDNISVICTHLWRKARCDVLAPRREEAGAVRAMRDLYAWGELISRGFQSDDLEENITDWGSGMGSLSSCIGTDVWEKIGEAASNLCEYLGSDEALLACEEVLNELKELKEKVDGGGNPEGFGCIL